MGLVNSTLNILGQPFLALPQQHFKRELKLYQQPIVRVRSTADEKNSIYRGKKANVEHGLKQKVLS